MWVLKLGGSLYRSPQLTLWLDALLRAPQRLVVVPGGGPFADSVRQAQTDWALSEAAAHRMAVLGMQQMACLLCDLRRDLEPAETLAEMQRIAMAGRVPVWMPDRLLHGQPDIACSWEVTSDSLAAWLANQLNAQGLVLVKSAKFTSETASIVEQQQHGLLDGEFQRYIGEVPSWLMHQHDPAQLPGLLLDPQSCPAGLRLKSEHCAGEAQRNKLC